jgi:uncharacterized protein YeaO (DUF488 family)
VSDAGPRSPIHLARVYDHEGELPGQAFFVERLWPRGVRRDDLPAVWLKDAAPSPELRRWYGHDVSRWEEFRRRYQAELDASPQTWQPIAEAAAAGDVTLLYGARDRDHNSALVLRDHVQAHLAGR